MKTYERMKPSNVLWLGDIPEHWEERFLEQTCREKCVKNINNTESNVLSLSYGYIIKKKNVYAGLTPQDFSTYQIVQKGDIILRFTDLQNDHKSLRTGLVTQTGIITAAYTCIAPTINSDYLHYLLHAYDLKKVFYGMGGGVRQSIGYKDVRHMNVLVPPREEQDQIVRFLDWKVSGINRLIHIKKKEIEQLNELKKSIVSRAVTRGLNPHAPLKDSNIQWLGQIPSHWETVRGKNLYMKMQRAVADNDEVVTCFRDGTVTLRKNRRTTGFTESLKEFGYQGIKKGDLVIHVMDAFAGAIGVSDSDGKGTPVYNVCQAKGNINNYYYAYLLREMARTGYIQSLYRGIRERSSDFRFEVFANQFYFVPPREEQDEIVRYLDEQTKKIQSATCNKQEQIEKLQEFKTRLISDVVTGKLDVRGIEIPGDVFFDGDTQDIHDEEQED